MTSSGTRKFLRAPGGNGELRLTENESEATEFLLCKLNGKYVFVYENSPNQKRVIDYFDNNHAIFSTWQKVPGANNMFTLGLPKEDAAVYRYPAYDGSWGDSDPDTGSTNNLPDTETELRTADPYTIAAPSQSTYYSRSDLMQWNYSFAGWRVRGTSTVYQPGDTVSSLTDTLDLEAVWSFTGTENIGKTVLYNLAFAKTPASIPEYSKMTISDNREIVSGADMKTYEVPTLTPAWYKAAVAVNLQTGNVYEFVGWKTESGDIIDSAFVDLTDPSFDVNGDDVVSLTAVWNNTYENGAQREVQFFVSTVAISADAFNDEVPISTSSADFTQAVHHSLMDPSDIPAPQVSYHPGLGQTVYTLADYEDKNRVNIAGNDELIRQLSTTGLEKDGVTYSLMDFPSDEEVLEYLKKQDKARLTLDGMEVDPADINTDNFTIRWYVCKYQQNGFWHIDGKLTPNLSYLRIEKNFLGDETALEHIPSNFEIGVTSATKSQEGIISNVNHTDIHLTLNDQRGNKQRYGLYSGTATNGNYGYIEKNGNTYVWLVPVVRGAQFDITEKNYDAVVGNVTYGIAAQYSVTKSQEEGGDVTRVPWFGTVNGYSATYPRTSIDIDDTSNIQSINLFNTYVETGTFVMQKIDTGLDGTGSAPMPGVKFKVYDITDGANDEVQITRNWNAREGHYNLQMYDPTGQTISGDPQTGDDGSMYLRLAADNPDTASTKTFKIVEEVPDGYVSGDEDPYVIVTVDKNGNFTVDQKQEPAGEHGRIEVLKTGVPGAGEEEATISGVTVYNQPKAVTVAVGKSWDSVNRQDSVTLQFRGVASGKTVYEESLVLDDSNTVLAENKLPSDPEGEWIHTWPQRFPMMYGNAKVDYTVVEKKIGPYAEGSASYNNWTQGYTTACYEGDNEVSFDSSFAYDKIALDVLNVDRNKDFIRTMIFKADGSSGKNLLGAEFEVFTERAGSKTRLEFDGQLKYVVRAGTMEFTTENMNRGIPLNLEFGKTYYFRETKTPDGYKSKGSSLIQVSVDESGNVSVATMDPWTNEEVAYHETGTREATLDPSSWSSEDASAVLSGIGSAQIEAQTGMGDDRKPYAIFLIDGATDKAVATPDIANFGIANYSSAKEPVILKKVNGGKAPLEGAIFEILRCDRSLVSGVDINGVTTTRFTSGANGEYFVGTLPYGTYYMHEVVVPNGVRQNGSEGWWYTLTVNESGVSLGERRSAE